MEENTIDAVYRLLTEISEVKSQVKTAKDGLNDVLEQNDEYKKLQEELKELTKKRGEAKKMLQADKDYQAVNTELDELKFKLKDLHEILSHHLVTYYNETQNTEITAPDGEVMQLVLSAKIGRPGAS
jgi:predicted  nucleic acid-binding Zn-ribbon protein